MISHDLSVLADVCDRLAVMYAGRVVEQGPSREVFHDAAAPLHAGPVRRLPADRRPGSRLAPTRAAGDPPDPRDCRPAARSIRAARWRWTRARRRDGALAGGRRPYARPACTCGRGRRPHDRDGDVPGDRRHGASTLLEARDLHVDFAARAGGGRRAVDGVNLAIGAGEIVALVGESGLRQDHAGALADGAGAAHRRGRSSSTASRWTTAPRRCKAYRQARAARPPGPDGLAEPAAHRLRGGRRGPAHPRPARRRGDRGGGAVPGRAAAPRAVLPALPARAVGRPAPARGDRGRAGPRPEGPRRRRAGGLAGRLGARRDPRAAAAAARRTWACRRWWSPTTSGWPGTSPTGSR